MRRSHQLSHEAQRELAAIEAALEGRPAEGDLAQLALLLRDERPELDAGARARLDGRAAGGFVPRAAAPSRARRMLLPALGASATILVVAAGIYGGAGGGDGPGSSSRPDAAVLAGEPAAKVEPPRAPSSDRPGIESADATTSPAPNAAAAPSPQTATSGLPSRSVQRAAQLSLVTTPARLDEVAGDVMSTTDALGGYVVSSDVGSRGSRGGSASFQLRVPSARLETALARLSKLARVRARNTSSLDVTGQVVSARERVDALQAERRGVLRRLAAATTPAETAAAREQLRQVDARLARAQAQRESLRRSVAFSTIGVELMAVPGAGAGAPADDPWTPGDALRLSVRVLEVAAGALLVALAVLVPVSLLAGFGSAGWRAVRSRRRNALLDAAT